MVYCALSNSKYKSLISTTHWGTNPVNRPSCNPKSSDSCSWTERASEPSQKVTLEGMAQAAGSALSLGELPIQLSICPAVKSEKGRTTPKQDCNTIISSLIIKKTEYCNRGVLFPLPFKATRPSQLKTL